MFRIDTEPLPKTGAETAALEVLPELQIDITPGSNSAFLSTLIYNQSTSDKTLTTDFCQ